MLRKTIKESLVVLIIALILAIGIYALRPAALPLVNSQSVPETVPNEDTLYEPISIDQAEEMFNQGSAVFADARSLAAYEEGHISGAVHLDPQDFDQWSDELIAQYPPEQIIIAYCHGTQCDLSRCWLNG